MKKIGLICVTTLACLSLAACGNQSSSKNNNSSSTAQSTKHKYYFNGTTANLHDIKIHIDKVSYYSASDSTDGKDIICFDYTIKNKTDKDINALTGWQSTFNAYQDNKNTEGKLDVASMPSDTSDHILHDQDQTIKKGGSVKCRMAYELDSNSKPVVLKATKGYDDTLLGKKVYRLNKLKKNTNEPSNNQSISSTNSTKLSNAESSQTQPSSASNNNKVVIDGHSFHHEDFYGNDVLVGDNGEGEAGEWAANEPGVQNNQSVKDQLDSIYGN